MYPYACQPPSAWSCIGETCDSERVAIISTMKQGVSVARSYLTLGPRCLLVWGACVSPLPEGRRCSR